jgi:hypothetical protein
MPRTHQCHLPTFPPSTFAPPYNIVSVCVNTADTPYSTADAPIHHRCRLLWLWQRHRSLPLHAVFSCITTASFLLPNNNLLQSQFLAEAAIAMDGSGSAIDNGVIVMDGNKAITIVGGGAMDGGKVVTIPPSQPPPHLPPLSCVAVAARWTVAQPRWTETE